jgi:hypothetical protein
MDTQNSAPKQRPRISLARIALNLGIAALVMSALPYVSFLTWLIAIPAIVISIIALAKSFPPMEPTLGLIFAIVGWGVSLFAIFITAEWLESFEQLSSPLTEVSENSTTQEPAPATPDSDTAISSWPAVTPLTLEGSGDDVVMLDDPISLAAMDVWGNESGRYLTIRSILSSGETGDLLVLTTEPVNGTVLLDGSGSKTIQGFEISAIGPWALGLKSIAEVPIVEPGAALEGAGHALVRMNPTQGLVTLSVAGNEVGRAFSVRSHGDRPQSVILSADSYDGTVRLDTGTTLLEITAIGPWSITLNK